MQPGNDPSGAASQYALAGLETGVIAALALLAWLGASARWYHHSFWTTPNLLASTFYGESALRNRFTVHTFSGLALFFLIYGAAGALFGLAVRDRGPRLRVTCIGILAAIGWYYALGWIWRNWNPLIVLYTHERPLFAGHVLFGAVLGSYPGNLRKFRPAAHAAVAHPPAIPAADPAADRR
jgi:hypothetical protein